MKLSTVIATGAVLAGAIVSNASASTVLATVFNGYGYNYGAGDQQVAYVTASVNLSDVIIDGDNLGALAAGASTSVVGLGDFEYGGNPSIMVSIVDNGHTYSGTFTGVFGDCDCYNAAESVGTLSAVPEPATWALLTLGFGGLGLAMRTSRKLGLASQT